tara:strand:- start:389 stop:856 length:468 start_codon:yes stop_codon:yes gene_type:complete
MKLEVLRFNSGKDSTSGALFSVVEGVKTFLCYTLEDEYRDTKVYSETRIPAGIYNIEFRNEGGFNNKYSKRFSDIHVGMLHITNVPGFEYILIHCGNTDEHTAGCLLVGDSQENNSLVKDGFIGKSSQAYKRIYPKIAKALQAGEEVKIEYIDYA